MTKSDPQRRRGRPRTMDPDKVLDLAMTQYWQGEPGDVSVNTICQLAGIAKPSLYRVFGNEDGLMRAALDSYAERVLAKLFAILEAGSDLRSVLGALVAFICTDPEMENGCLFHKMRADQHRLGPATRAGIEELAAASRAAFGAFFRSREDVGDWPDGLSVMLAAQYVSEQLALAASQRAAGEDPAQIEAMLNLALTMFDRPQRAEMFENRENPAN